MKLHIAHEGERKRVGGVEGGVGEEREGEGARERRERRPARRGDEELARQVKNFIRDRGG